MTDGHVVFNPRRLVARLALLAAGLAVPALVVVGSIRDDRPAPVSPITESPSRPREPPAPGATSGRLEVSTTDVTGQPAMPYGPGAASGPVTLGDDEALDTLWVGCEAGSGAACDELFERSPVGSEYELFAVSCGNRPLVLDCTAELDGDPSEDTGPGS